MSNQPKQSVGERWKHPKKGEGRGEASPPPLERVRANPAKGIPRYMKKLLVQFGYE